MPGAFLTRQLGRLQRAGLTPRQERAFKAASIGVVVLFAFGWTYAIATAALAGESPRVVDRLTANPLAADAPPEAAFLLDATLRAFADAEPVRGASGAVNVVVQHTGDTLALPDTLPPGVEAELAPAPGTRAGDPARAPGIWNVVLKMGQATRQVPRLNVIRTVPLSQSRGGRMGTYRVGEWPSRGGIYAPPKGLIEVTPQNMGLRVSKHLTLGDFLTKGQENVWPKYVAMSPRLLDKVELTIQQLEAAGHPVRDVGVISAFRHPYYNAHGGSTGGRGALSRHMYGDAMDFYIDNDGDGRMDDLNGDGRVDIGDARVIGQAAERVEKRHPTLIGGIGIYRPTGAHSGFVHLDTRGFRARW